MEYSIKKSLGQHFLKDEVILKKIVDALNNCQFTNLVEVGPGAGALTKYLIALQKINFKAVELDDEKVPYLINTYPILKDKIIGLKGNYAIQGEFCGPKVNGNKMKLKAYKWYIFTIKNLDTNKYLDYYELNNFCQEYNFEMVPN